MVEEKIIETIDDKIENQYLKCRRDYYKNMLRIFFGSAGTIVIVLAGIIGWSYQPLADIQVLKMEMKIMQEKLDLIIKQNGKDKEKKIIEEKEEKKEIKLNVMDFTNPALGAIANNDKD